MGPRTAKLRRICAGSATLLAVCLGPAAGAAPPSGASQPDRFDTVVIDAGHGGDDQGALGGHGLIEKELVLDVARRLEKRLRASGRKVVLTRKSDVFVPLELRTSVANDARGDLFVSIHANSAATAPPRGTETFFASLESSDDAARQVAARENDAFGGPSARNDVGDPLVALLGDMIETEHMLESNEFAKLAQAELAKLATSPSRGVKQAPFVVLMGVQMPAALVEIGFITNPKEERELADDAHRERVAEALARAIADFAGRYDARRGVERTSGGGGS